MGSGDDEVQNLLGEGDNDTAGQGEKAVGPLGGVVALEREAHLDDAPPKKDEAHRADEAKDEGGQVVDHGERIAPGARGKGGHGAAPQQGEDHDHGAVPAEAPLDLTRHREALGGAAGALLDVLVVHETFPPFL